MKSKQPLHTYKHKTRTVYVHEVVEKSVGEVQELKLGAEEGINTRASAYRFSKEKSVKLLSDQNYHKIEELDQKHAKLMQITKLLFGPIIFWMLALFCMFIVMQLLSFLVLLNSQPDTSLGFVIISVVDLFLMHSFMKALAVVGDRYLVFVGHCKLYLHILQQFSKDANI